MGLGVQRFFGWVQALEEIVSFEDDFQTGDVGFGGSQLLFGIEGLGV